MGPFPGNERTWKPFNPILGETFELSMDNGLRFIAEQVCCAVLLLDTACFQLCFARSSSGANRPLLCALWDVL